MKKSLIALAVLAAAAGSASAQSSVTVFGVLDVAYRHLDNDTAGTRDVLGSSGLSTGRLGFRGVEDLGGGLKAGFWLESEVKPDEGSQPNARFWHRRATVSLISDSLGEVRLGRDFAPTYSALADFDAFGTTGIGDTTRIYKVWGSVDSKVRNDNQVTYFLPANLGGVYGQLSVAAGEGTAGKKYYGGRLGYAAGPLNVNVGYGQTEVTNSDVKLTVIGGSYDLGVAKLMAAYQQGKYQGNKDKHYTVGATVPVGAFVLRAAYSKSKSNDATDRDADRIALGAVYNLSKRTALYGTYAVIDNDDAAKFTVSNDYSTIDAGDKSQGLEIGIRHSF
ncbi:MULTISPECIES: porin [Rubrivivax]|uniref:porin n=1 Tax=Rubrivivax TaxID=28067 RepID=UPI00020A4C0E|nr:MULTISPECIES: porin [Rubrivivax]EGJ12426.1 gram-negative type outer membrane porin protein [Rubrivivax benzoatilyticus JA2 = ATCC BAA-35]MCC9596873.1 porin [Rubrivivax sp. JA1055]MCD0421188.1 porin [Rubrivivax sp. JA1024]